MKVKGSQRFSFVRFSPQTRNNKSEFIVHHTCCRFVYNLTKVLGEDVGEKEKGVKWNSAPCLGL